MRVHELRLGGAAQAARGCARVLALRRDVVVLQERLRTLSALNFLDNVL